MAIEKYVVRLDIAMHDAVSVRVVERIGDLTRYSNRFIGGKSAIRVELVAKRLPFYVRHYVIEESICFARIVERNDVRMPQSRYRLNFSQESLGPEAGSQLRMQHFHCDGPVVPQISCEIDGGHSASAYLALDLVAIGKRGPEPGFIHASNLHSKRGFAIVGY